MKLKLAFLANISLCLSVQAPGDHLPNPPPYNLTVDNGTYGYYPTNTYSTFGLRAPKTNFLQWSPKCDDGLYYFITPRGWSESKPGPMILDRLGDLVWLEHFDNKFGGQAYDFMVQKYQGEDYLTFWLGDDRIRGHGTGHYYILNSSYDLVHKVSAANGLSADLHEFLITPEGTALMTVYEVTSGDVTPLGRVFDEVTELDTNYIWDCVFQEIALDTGDLIFEWRASEHVDIIHTYRPIGPGGTKADPFDWFHLNSVEKDKLGNYLISARYPQVIIYIDGRTGETIWTLGGKGNDFMDLSDGYATNFAYQHDARFISTDMFPSIYTPPPAREGYTTNLVSLFDNSAEDRNYDYGLSYSRALLLEVTYPTPDTNNKYTAGDLSPPLIKREDSTAHSEEPLSESDIERTRQNNGTDLSHTVRVIKSYKNPIGIRSGSQGSVQLIPQADGSDPHIFVGYGLNAIMTEFHPNGTALCDIHYGASISWERGDIQSYRAFKFPWIGRPRTNPAVDISNDDREIYVSWNGATEVRGWLLQASHQTRSWQDIVTMRKTGFETAIPLFQNTRAYRYLRLVALDADGNVLDNGISEAADRGYITALMTDPVHPIWEAVPLPLKFLVITVTSITVLMVFYGLLRHYVLWRSRRPYGGLLPLPRKGLSYQPVRRSEA